MTRRRSAACDRAIRLVASGVAISVAAERAGISRSTLQKALRQDGVAPAPHRPRGKGSTGTKTEPLRADH